MMPQSINNDDLTALKKSWLDDPCWDIEDSEGFEAHKAELLAWRKNHEARYQLEQNIIQAQGKVSSIEQALKEANKLPTMALHETMQINKSLSVTRVNDGFIYTTITREEFDTNSQDANGNRVYQLALANSSVFVPFGVKDLNFQLSKVATQDALLKAEDMLETYLMQLEQLPQDF